MRTLIDTLTTKGALLLDAAATWLDWLDCELYRLVKERR